MKLLNTLDLKNRDLWLVRVYFFLFYAGGAFLFPFISLFYERRGLSGAQIGLLGTVGAAVQLVGAPVWGHASDSVARPRRLLQVALIGSSIMMLALSQQTIFLWMLIIIGVAALLSSGSIPLSDKLALGVSNGKNYGSVRLWGSLGWAMFVLLAGWLIEQTGIFIAFAGHAVSLVFCAFFLLLIAPGAVQKGQAQQEEDSKRGLAVMREGLLNNPHIMWMSAALVVVVSFRVGITNFEPIYLDQLGAPESLIGLGATIAALVELPAMLWADRLNEHIGPRQLFMAGNGIHMAIMATILLFPSVTTIVATKVAIGFAYSFFLISLVNFVHEAVPENQQATGLALFMVTLPSLTSAVANPLNGFLFDVLGAYWLYAFALCGYAISTIILWRAVPQMR